MRVPDSLAAGFPTFLIAPLPEMLPDKSLVPIGADVGYVTISRSPFSTILPDQPHVKLDTICAEVELFVSGSPWTTTPSMYKSPPSITVPTFVDPRPNGLCTRRLPLLTVVRPE